jgi:hypothetical protein
MDWPWFLTLPRKGDLVAGVGLVARVTLHPDGDGNKPPSFATVEISTAIDSIGPITVP